MSTSTRSFREEHEHLLEDVEHVRQAAIELPGLDVDGRTLLLARVQAFLHETLIPPAQSEGRVLAHFRKEEELYLPLLERDPAKAELLIEEMAGEHVHCG